MSPPTLRLNPVLDVQKYADIYARDGLVQIPDVFEKPTAELISEIMETSLPWSLSFSGEEGRPVKIPMEALQGAAGDIREQVAALIQRSGKQYGFIYFNFGMVSAYNSGEPRANHPIHPVTGFLMGEEFAAFGRQLTGDQSIRWADSQATLYRPNDFLGLHDDSASDDVQRVAAYTLGFTSRWRSDWGGQTLFHDPETGDITRGLIPRWNTLTVFRVPQLHSVASVAGYAQSARLSIVGWFRRDR